MAEAKTKEYTLKPGVTHSYIKDGERVKVTGDGKLKVPLTDGQFPSFKDKLVGGDSVEEVTATQDAVDSVASGEPKNGASGGASAASSGTPEPASKEDAETLKSATSDGKAGKAEDKKAEDKK